MRHTHDVAAKNAFEKSLENDQARARLSAAVSAYALSVPPLCVLDDRRGSARTALARQLAMYLTHIAFEMSLARVAAAFRRDRSTIAHACHRIEDRRDDPVFDAYVDSLEAALRETPPPGVFSPFEALKDGDASC